MLGENLTDEQLNHLFMKIDANTDNYIDWDDFSTFMLMRAEGQKKMKEEAENQLFEIEPSILHRIPLPTPHKDLIGIIIFLPHVRKYLTCSRDGTITYWSDRLKVQRTFKQVG